MACADCNQVRPVMLVQGNGLEVCSRCYRGTVFARSASGEADEATAKRGSKRTAKAS